MLRTSSPAGSPFRPPLYRAVPRRSRWRMRVALTLLAALAIAAALHAVWLPWPARWLAMRDPIEPADAVVLTYSSAARSGMDTALELLHSGQAGSVLVSDYEIDIPGIEERHIGDLVTKHLVEHGVPVEQIVRLPASPANEREEALRIAAVFRERGWRTGIVLAKPWRMRRTILALRAAARGEGVRYLALPIADSTYQPERWWRTREGIPIMFNEYPRLLFYALRGWF